MDTKKKHEQLKVFLPKALSRDRARDSLVSGPDRSRSDLDSGELAGEGWSEETLWSIGTRVDLKKPWKVRTFDGYGVHKHVNI